MMIKLSMKIFLNFKKLQQFVTFFQIYFQNYSYKTKRHLVLMQCLDYHLNVFDKQCFKKYFNCLNLITHRLSLGLLYFLFNLKKRILFYFIEINIYLYLSQFYFLLDCSYLFLLLFSLVSLIFDICFQIINFFNQLNFI